MRGGGTINCMSKIKFTHTYNDIISLENLLLAWKEFIRGKKSRKDVQEFEYNLMENIILLHNDLQQKTYRHGPYEAFKINDPKPRDIHKATVRDRLLHHAVYRKLYPFFDRIFIFDSNSCRLQKGTHKAMERFRDFTFSTSQNHIRTAWILKCDIRKFFANIDQTILLTIIKEYIPDEDIIWLLSVILKSFHSNMDNIGLPLGNLTSQLFVNIYMNKFDQYVKHKLKAKYYIRYTDDFVVISRNRIYLEHILLLMQEFLRDKLKLFIHPNKVSIRTIASGIDFLGWVHFPHHQVLRTTTKKRMFKKIHDSGQRPETVQSYLGLLKHGNSWKLQQKIEDRCHKKP